MALTEGVKAGIIPAVGHAPAFGLSRRSWTHSYRHYPPSEGDSMNGIADQQAVGFGFLAMFAEDMYAPIGSLNPPADTRIAKSGWTIIAYLTAQDALFPQKEAANRHISLSKRVFFGFLARNTDDPTVYAAVVRGTDGIVEWVIDAAFCYCAMVVYAIPPPAAIVDAESKACIAPPPMSDAAKGLAAVINEFGIGDKRSVAMLKAVHTISVM